MINAAVIPAISAGLQLAAFAAKKSTDAAEINTYIDRAALANRLFSTDADKAAEAYRTLYAEIQTLCAKQGITPSIYYEGAPCLNIPLANLIELMDAATGS
ncbi:MAG: hypothetical protein HYY11_02965 [Candidatus Methylomirabilis oxyfera]|nr:hypothetical protein [Candidatus Methylomirabilis oxyfera]